MSDILKQIQALQEQFNNLLGEELEKEGPKGEIKDLSRPPKKDYFDKKIEAAKTNFRTADKVARNNWKKFQASDDIDSSGYSDSYADARTADNEREKALDNYEYTKKEMNAARKGKRIEPKSTMEQIRRIRARREGAIKMNDNNSYNEIVSQIMDLKEAFSNLFEVDDLGQPAMDVPPSQNKIKRDRKTKDGKVELVSVEDELFPYEGNKREQYRQKILDTINNMIQGKATLEDLLQIVRQKKAPLKEAMEILESVFSQIEKVHGEPEWRNTRVGFVPMNKSAELQDKADKNAYDEFQQARKRENKSEEELDKKRNETKNNPLEEAIELMEDLFSTILKQPDEKQGSLVYKYHQAKNKENAGKDTYTQAKEEEKRKSKEEKGQEKTEQRKKYRGKSTEDWKQGRLMDQIAKNAAKLAKVSDPATAKAIRRNAQRADLKEAMEVLEELIKEGRNLEDVVVRSYDKGKVSLDDLQKLMDKAHEVPSDSSYFHKSKGEKGELRTKHRHMDYERNVLSDGWGKDDNKKIEASIKRKAKNDKSFPVFQALKAYKEGKADIKEALEIMEDIWSKIQEQPSDKKEELTRMYYKMKQKEGKTTSDIIDDRKKHMTKQEKGQEKTKERNQKAWKNYLDAVRDYTESTPSMYQFEALEKALSLTEEIINEVSVGALARAVENNLPKRKKNEEVAIKAYKQAQNEYEKGSKESPEDEPALYKKLQCTDKAACKEFDKARDAENLKDLNLPKDSKVSANKLFNAAKKVNPERQKKTEETVKNTKGTKEDAKKFLNSLKRDNRSFDISLADPVKSRNEAN